MARSRRRVLIYSLVVVVAGLAAAEAVCRVAEETSRVLVGPFEKGGADGGIGFGPGGRLDHDGAVTVFNEGAYVGELRPAERRPGVPRVVVLGDSFTFGWGIGHEHAWPALVDAALPDVEVLNFAVPGQNTWLELEHYRRTARGWRPDVVLVGWYLNDALIDRRSPNVLRLCPLASPRERLRGRLEEHSALVRVLIDLANIRRHGGPLPPWDSEGLMRAEALGFRCSMHWLEELKAEVEADGARLVVVQTPHLDGVGTPADPERSVQRFLGAELSSRGLERFSLYPAVARQSPDAMRIDGLHPSVEAHRRFADRLVPKVAALAADTLSP